MEVGCGARVREIRGHQYFYFWHYERESGRSVRTEDYVGPVDGKKARRELLQKMAATAPGRSRTSPGVEAGSSGSSRGPLLPLLRGNSTRPPRADDGGQSPALPGFSRPLGSRASFTRR